MEEKRKIIFCPHNQFFPIYGTRKLHNPYKGTQHDLARFLLFRNYVLGVKCMSCGAKIIANSLVHTGYPYYSRKPRHSYGNKKLRRKKCPDLKK